MLGKDPVGGTSQLQTDCRQWEIQGSRSEENTEHIPQKTHTIQPKGILVIGHLDQLDGLSKRTTFELYRRNITNLEKTRSDGSDSSRLIYIGASLWYFCAVRPQYPAGPTWVGGIND